MAERGPRSSRPEFRRARRNNSSYAWDYFHINSIEKDAAGNYLLSARHTKAIYCASGQDGRILWTLGGKSSSFTMGPNAAFSWQHDGRWRSGNTISPLDNAAAAWAADLPTSRGLVLALGTAAMSATLGHEVLPFNCSLFKSQGSMDALSSSDASGTVVTGPEGAQVWVSRNGATEVAVWERLQGHHGRGCRRRGEYRQCNQSGFRNPVATGRICTAATSILQAWALSSDGMTLGFSRFVFANNSSDAGPLGQSLQPAVSETLGANRQEASFQHPSAKRPELPPTECWL